MATKRPYGRRMLARAGTGLAALGLLSAVPFASTVAHADTEEPALPPPPTSFVVGDSITMLGAPYLRRLHPDWYVYGVGGPNVTSIPKMVNNILSLNPNPKLVVIALGTNASPLWTKAQLKAAIATLPPRRRSSS